MTSEIQGAVTNPAFPASSARTTTTPEHGFSFHDFLSAINPLQYVPIVGKIYRAITGDVIPEALRNAGSMLVSGLLGGPVGLGINVATTIAEKVTGIDPEKIVAAQLNPAPSAATLPGDIPAVAPVQPASVQPASAQSASARPESVGFASAPSGLAQPAAPEPGMAQFPWTPAQLAAYGVRSGASGTLKLGTIEGADVLNTIQLVALGQAAAAYAANQTTSPKV